MSGTKESIHLIKIQVGRGEMGRVRRVGGGRGRSMSIEILRLSFKTKEFSRIVSTEGPKIKSSILCSK